MLASRSFLSCTRYLRSCVPYGVRAHPPDDMAGSKPCDHVLGSYANSIVGTQGSSSPHSLPCTIYFCSHHSPRREGCHSVPIPAFSHCPHHKSVTSVQGTPCSSCPLPSSQFTLFLRSAMRALFSISSLLQVGSAQPEVPPFSCTHTKCLIIAPSQLTCHLLREAPARSHPPLRAGLCSRHSTVIRQGHSTWFSVVPNSQSPEQGQAHSRCSPNTCSLDSEIRAGALSAPAAHQAPGPNTH